MPSYAIDEWRRHGNTKKPAGTGRASGSVVRSNLVTIGQLARETGVTPRAIRHYERLALIETPVRTDANYRLFDSDSVSRVKFIAKCRLLGFSIPEIADFLQIMEDPDHTCAQVAGLTRQHLGIVDTKIKDLVEMRHTLARTLSRCTGKDVPEGAVLEFLKTSA